MLHRACPSCPGMVPTLPVSPWPHSLFAAPETPALPLKASSTRLLHCHARSPLTEGTRRPPEVQLQSPGTILKRPPLHPARGVPAPSGRAPSSQGAPAGGDAGHSRGSCADFPRGVMIAGGCPGCGNSSTPVQGIYSTYNLRNYRRAPDLG